MKVGFLLTNLDGPGGTARSVITQAGALADLHDVTLLSVLRTAERPHHPVDPRVRTTYLVDVRDPGRPATTGRDALVGDLAATLHRRESALVPRRWDPQLSALADVALERTLPGLGLDAVVTTTPGLLAAATTLLPARTVVVHQEHRASHTRTGGLEPLLAHAPQADVVALLTPTVEAWLREQLGELAPETVVVPNPLPPGHAPRSALDQPLVVTGGRLVGEKQLPRLVDAFAEVAGRAPGWRLRICGDGPQRAELLRQVRKHDLWDRVELPGTVPDMAAEWASASVAVLSSRTEGYPLVLQEAMAAGVPVVSFDSPSGPREIIEHEVNGLLVAPQATSGLAAALLRLVDDVDLRHRLGAGALRTAARWDAAAVARRWDEVLTGARERRGSHGRLEARALAPRPADRDDRPAADTGLDAGSGTTPAEARAAALAWAVDAVRTATDTWLVVPAHEHPAPLVVAPADARDAVLEALARPGCPAYLCLRDPAEAGWPERRGPVADLAADLRSGRTSVVALEPWPDGGVLTGAGGVEVEFWEHDAAGDLVAPRRNPYADRLPPAVVRSEAVEAEVDGVTVRSLPLLLAPTATEVRFPVDAVVTWVDGRDPAWDAARAARLAESGEAAQARTASGRARFVDHGELRFALRSLHLFAPWLRRIHLVTAGQVPAWLDHDHPGVRVVDHREILPADALPTFSSHAIETALHRVPGLAEHFVYLNDDFLLGRPLRPEALFSPAGLTSVFLSRQNVGLTGDTADPDVPPFVRAAWHNRQLLQERFGAVTLRHLAHAPYAHRVSVLEALEREFPEALAATARRPFRSGDDVSTLSSLAQHYGLLSGTAYVASLEEHPLTFVNLSNAGVEGQLRRALRREQDFLCLGDHHDHALDGDRLARSLDEFLRHYYPLPAPWEAG
ncbi:stealth conserved region 3 domain-containing protein [Nocardioides litoris]|uniref:stealth conserved region 3 domain-containing protein n=1 Tax=Nocardioides litoris TaxID=1926648 RepID=UPI0014769686|nr:stealth conserved region 3 domain-containing protein [Nocardioides litoris]